MGGKDLKDMVIPEVPSGEVLKEGTLNIMTFKKRWYTFPYKYVITEKGVWVRNPKRLLGKERSVFMPYEMFSCYETTSADGSAFCLFHRKDGSEPNRVCFDDIEGAVKVLDEYLDNKQV
ncbi:MAG: hypothetical protein LBV13_06405 [Methanomassiliicoccaceae archaeon]|jgi:hypothetical protein|nr:hypothetical protein [Methanomassiliicoccaceae archaeon]